MSERLGVVDNTAAWIVPIFDIVVRFGRQAEAGWVIDRAVHGKPQARSGSLSLLSTCCQLSTRRHETHVLTLLNADEWGKRLFADLDTMGKLGLRVIRVGRDIEHCERASLLGQKREHGGRVDDAVVGWRSGVYRASRAKMSTW